MFSGGKFTEVSVWRADRRRDLFFQYKLSETVTTTKQLWKVTKTEF